MTLRDRLPGLERAALATVSLAAVASWAAGCGGAAGGDGAAGARAGGVEAIGGRRGERPGSFVHPRALTVDAAGRLFVVDRSGRVQLFGPQGRPLGWWMMPRHDQGFPVGIHAEPGGTVLVNDSHYQRIRRYAPPAPGALPAPEAPPDGAEGGRPAGETPAAVPIDDEVRELAAWGSLGTGPGQFTFGRDVVVDAEGHVYAGDYGGLNDRIQKFGPDGAFLLEWGGRGTEPGRFDRPQGMCVEARPEGERLLVADTNNHRIQRFDLQGDFVDAWGGLGEAPGRLRYPLAVAVDEAGGIYVCEWGNHRVQKFDREGRSLGVWGAPGRDVGELHSPWDIEVGPDGTIFVADYGNHRVQAFRWPGGGAS